MLPVAVTRSSFGEAKIRYVLPVLSATPNSAKIGQTKATLGGRLHKVTHQEQHRTRAGSAVYDCIAN